TADDEDAGDAGDDDESAVEEDPAEEFKAELRMQEGDWYVIHSYAGYENRVKQNLENRTISLNLEEYIFESQVPMEDVVEIKNGQRKQVRRVRMPGYVLVRMELTDESWGAVRHTPGVTGFVGNAYDPTPSSGSSRTSRTAPSASTSKSTSSNRRCRWKTSSRSRTASASRSAACACPATFSCAWS